VRAASNDNCRSMITAWARAAGESEASRHALAAPQARDFSMSGM
jgi:hypothetical protein